MRIVSLLPSATEIVCLLGLRDSLVGRSHECDFPVDVRNVPTLTYSNIGVTNDEGVIDTNLSSAEIDKLVSNQLHDGLSLYGLHHDRLEAAQPDLILTQELCDVCAVSFDTVNRAVRDLSRKWNDAANVVSLEPTNIKDVFETILIVGELTNTLKVAKQHVSELRARLDIVRENVKNAVHRPTVAALEWLDPPFAPGHWVPEQIEIAGGRCVLGEAGKPSTRCDWDDVIHTQAEMVVAMPCGFDLQGAVNEFSRVAHLEVWRDLPATYLTQLYAVDATSYFSRPGPRVVDGVEILSGLIHPNRCPHPNEMQAARVLHLIRSELKT
jgi:iron complex transport system substrate-binding protein